jgi:hypothetical protein
MLVQEDYIKEAATYLAILADYTGTMSSLNLNDCSVVSENFFAQLLNVVYGYELKNINLISHNASVIDLYDSTNRISVQITSTKSLTKIKDCLQQFLNKKLYNKYNQLFVYILTKKQQSYKLDTVKESTFEFDRNIHVIDKTDLLKKMMGLEPVVQKQVVDILKAGIKLPDNKELIVSNEVETIINLITLLSNNEKGKVFDEETEIDPDKKIKKRFKEDAVIIDNQYFNLCIEYMPTLNSIEQNNDIDSVKHSKVSSYLKDCSTRLLIENNYDGMKAFDILMNEVTKLFHEMNISYDEMAIKFFLLKNLTECNVFPLLRGELKCTS